MFELSVGVSRARSLQGVLSLFLVIASACGGGGSGDRLFDGTATPEASRGGTGGSSGSAAIAGTGSELGDGGTSPVSTAGKPNGGAGGAATAGSGAGGSEVGGGGSGGSTPAASGTGGVAGEDGGQAGAGGGPTEEPCAVTDIVTGAVFEQLFPKKTRDAFYTYEGFIDATRAYPAFGAEGDCDARKRDLAAFFANVARQTSRLRYVEQVSKSTACASTVQSAPCAPGKKYFGRGPMQISWNYNYQAVSACLGLGDSLLSEPDAVAEDAVLAWRTGLWFWNTGGANRCKQQAQACAAPPDTSSCDSPHAAMVAGRGFGATIDVVNGAVECAGDADEAAKNAVRERVCYYREFVEILGTTPGPGEQSCRPVTIECD